MYAIIETNGQQHRVEPGSVLETNRLAGEPGETVQLENSVLMVNNEGDVKVGTPRIDGATVDLEIVEHYRGKKVVVFKMKRRKRYRRKKGHRQELTRATVKAINVE